MGESLSPVEVLLAKCRQVSDAISGHREAIAGLTVERDGMVAELRRLGLSERAVGRLLGISGPRVNQIMNPAPEAAAASAERVAELRERVLAADVPVIAPEDLGRHGVEAHMAAVAREAAVPPVVLQPPEPAPEPRRKAACKHPGVGRKQRCRACGQFNV